MKGELITLLNLIIKDHKLYRLFTGLIMYLPSQNKEHCIVLYCIVLYCLPWYDILNRSTEDNSWHLYPGLTALPCLSSLSF